MKVRVQLNLEGRAIDEQVSGSTADELLGNVKDKVQKALGWKGLVLAAMSPIAFARTAVQLFNERNNSQYALPDTAEEFVKLGVDLGYVTVLPD